MKNPDSLMATEGLEDSVARDNFQKLNRMTLAGTFLFTYGAISSELLNFSGATRSPMTLVCSRVGHNVTLQLPETVEFATKVGVTDPEFASRLPRELRPSTEVLLPWPLTLNDDPLMGLMRVETSGRVTWLHITGVDQWVDATGAAVQPSAATYLGA